MGCEKSVTNFVFAVNYIHNKLCSQFLDKGQPYFLVFIEVIKDYIEAVIELISKMFIGP